MLNNELFKIYPDVVTEQESLIIFYRKSAVCMANDGKYTEHTIHITRIIYFVGNF